MNAIGCPPHPHTPYTLQTLSIGETQDMAKRYVIEPTRLTRAQRTRPSQDRKEAASYGKQQN